MGSFAKYLISCIIGIFVGALCVLWFQSMRSQSERMEGEVASVVWRQNHFLLSNENLLNELRAQGVHFPEIVVAQAILETGNFKSAACSNKNNLFGLRKKDGTYMSFEHWTDCVAAYKLYIQRWEKCPEDYYQYLNDLGYAEDSLYTQKLRQIVRPTD